MEFGYGLRASRTDSTAERTLRETRYRIFSSRCFQPHVALGSADILLLLGRCRFHLPGIPVGNEVVTRTGPPAMRFRVGWQLGGDFAVLADQAHHPLRIVHHDLGYFLG